jgi:hypothetical protein
MCAVAVLSASSAATAVVTDEFSPPSWRGQEGSTYQRWDFLTESTTPAPDASSNQFGTPALRVNPVGVWDQGGGSHLGIWGLSGEIDVYIPNWPQIRPEKEILIQLTWKAGEADQSPFLPDMPIVGVAADVFGSMSMTRQDFSVGQDGWYQSVFDIHLWPNPTKEWITVKGDILVDQLIIDTICIPEPGTILLLGTGLLTVISRRRRFNNMAQRRTTYVFWGNK